MTHVVLAEPLDVRPAQLLTAAEWSQFFDEDGCRRYDEVELATVDIRMVENAPLIWSTDQWDEAMRDFVLFARSAPDEIARTVARTEKDPDLPSLLLELGFTPVELAPPAVQLMPESVDVDLVANAAHALRDGVAEFVEGYRRPDRLVSAVLDLFRTVELLLKARLALVDPDALSDHPNNPAVLARLADRGVALAQSDVATVAELRRLRNRLQHGSAAFNQRRVLSLCRKAVTFIDQFTYDELGLWIGDVVDGDPWRDLLALEEVSVLRPYPSIGASCTYCGAVPQYRDPDDDD